jgi:hypothetical protein
MIDFVNPEHEEDDEKVDDPVEEEVPRDPEQEQTDAAKERDVPAQKRQSPN